MTCGQIEKVQPRHGAPELRDAAGRDRRCLATAIRE